MDRRLRTPLPAQQGQRLKYVLRQPQEFNQNGAVQRLACLVAPSVVGRQEFLVPEGIEDRVCLVELLGT